MIISESKYSLKLSEQGHIIMSSGVGGCGCLWGERRETPLDGLGVGQRRLCVEWVSKLRPEDEKNISHVETAGKSTLSRRNNKHKGFEARTNLQLRGTERR